MFYILATTIYVKVKSFERKYITLFFFFFFLLNHTFAVFLVCVLFSCFGFFIFFFIFIFVFMQVMLWNKKID